MTLTEEQRVALVHAIDYINETDLPVGELDGFDREVLRNMVTTINHGHDVMKMIELLAAGEHDQWADWAQAILDSEPGLSDGRKAAWPEMIATPYENLSEELKDKDRREVHLRSQAALDYIQQQSAEIERLQASLIDLHAEYINTLEKNPGCSAWDLDEQSIEDQRRLRRNAAHAISIVEPPIYLQADQQATLTKSLKKEIRRLKHESKVEQEFTNSYIKRLHDAEARIKELEDAHKRSGAKYAKIINELRSSVYANIPGLDVGKIGPDAKPRSWQITEERIGLLRYCLDSLLDAPDIEESPGPRHSIEMLRTMLAESEQCE